MKVGILSMQRVSNYGSYWQARSLKEYFEKKNNRVEFIDIKPGKIISKSSSVHKYSLEKVKRLPFYYQRYRRDKMFYTAQIEDLNCFKSLNYREDYDLTIIGSDEVFNFIQISKWGFSHQLFGLMNNSNICTYAASFGFSTYEDIVNENIKEEMINCLNNIRNISVRDKNSYDIIHKLLPKKNIEQNFDPVLIGDFDILNGIQNSSNYILIYAYDLRFNDKTYINEIRKFAKQEKLEIYSVGFYQTWCDKNIYPEPKDIFGWFLNAKYIITDTFHGTIFSMRTHKKFVTIIRESNKKKLVDLIEKCGMNRRIVTSQDNLIEILQEEVDYSEFEQIREYERKKTIGYLDDCLNCENPPSSVG